ncbi:MarR family winged helix-turn-helix transcriptional regulator [uncultured Sphingomonas sp.]|uniref:MarR family winged helix-turn-helix transcriptional regulator n=1 Tax=uncultured Sphingomonas sp. TaxID=158754 RepID=UPI0026272FE0|nr:MarR family winged helix-turn-helix transcriptional regulator [uncultured Sphingomonas sp.]
MTAEQDCIEKPATPGGGDDTLPMLMMNLVRAVYWYDEALQAALRRAGWPPVTRMQSMLFANIANGVTRPARLAHNLGMTRQSMGQMIDELVRRRILLVTPDPADGRASIVRFSPEGRALTSAARATMRAIERELAERLGPAAAEQLETLLARDWGAPPDVAAPPNEPTDKEKII